MREFFPSFREAAEFARELARDLGESVPVRREDDLWVVECRTPREPVWDDPDDPIPF